MGEVCPDGHHVLDRSWAGKRVCRYCERSRQSLVDHYGHAAHGDFRVVCATCSDYGDFTDDLERGYTNHSALCLAVAALETHQSTFPDQTHDAKIVQVNSPRVESGS